MSSTSTREKSALTVTVLYKTKIVSDGAECCHVLIQMRDQKMVRKRRDMISRAT